MREIKFRVWNLRVSPPRMMYWGKDFFDLHLKHDSMRIKCSPGNEHFEVHVLTNEFFRDFMPSCQGEVILTQYTGLKDKNDKEIYEGDILDGVYIVEWDDASARFILVDTEEKRYCRDLSEYAGSEGDGITGNIYKNPELLKEV